MSVLGSAFLGALSAAPALVEATTGLQAFRGFAGTSVLILVGVATDTARKFKAELAMQKYGDLDSLYDDLGSGDIHFTLCCCEVRNENKSWDLKGILSIVNLISRNHTTGPHGNSDAEDRGHSGHQDSETTTSKMLTEGKKKEEEDGDDDEVRLMNVEDLSKAHHLLKHWLSQDQRIAALAHFGTQDVKEAAKDVTKMGQKELQQKFRLVYGTPTHSNNNEWLRRKLYEAIGAAPVKLPSKSRARKKAQRAKSKRCVMRTAQETL
eukprot:jgi/Picre1/28360/NNA_003766.t1